MRRVLIAALLCAACAPQPAPPEPTIVPPPTTHEATPLPPGGRTAPALCHALAQLVEVRRSGFADLRGHPLAERHWAAQSLLPEFDRCEIEGEGYPGAVYACRGHPEGAFDPVSLEPAFARLARDIDLCLAAPVWYPLRWQRGESFVFARGERQISWRLRERLPTPMVTLKLEEDLSGAGWYLRLAVETLH